MKSQDHFLGQKTLKIAIFNINIRKIEFFFNNILDNIQL